MAVSENSIVNQLYNVVSQICNDRSNNTNVTMFII